MSLFVLNIYFFVYGTKDILLERYTTTDGVSMQRELILQLATLSFN